MRPPDSRRVRPGQEAHPHETVSATGNIVTEISLLAGCPRGCPPRRHEWPCLVGEPIDGPVDYLDSAIFVIRDGAPALSSLRGQVAA
jgi:hypothetical protein